MKRQREQTLSECWRLSKRSRASPPTKQTLLGDWWRGFPAIVSRLLEVLPREMRTEIRRHLSPIDRVALQRACRQTRREDPGFILPAVYAPLTAWFARQQYLTHPLLPTYIRDAMRTQLPWLQDRPLELLNVRPYRFRWRPLMMDYLWNEEARSKLTFAICQRARHPNVLFLACDVPLTALHVDYARYVVCDAETGTLFSGGRERYEEDGPPSLYWYCMILREDIMDDDDDHAPMAKYIWSAPSLPRLLVYLYHSLPSLSPTCFT